MKRTYTILRTMCCILACACIMVSCGSGRSGEDATGEATEGISLSDGGRFGIWETYWASDVWPFMEQIDSLTVSLWPTEEWKQNMSATPIVGVVHISDTARVNELIHTQQAQEIFPTSLCLRWSSAPVSEAEQYYYLIALKEGPDGGSVIDNSDIKKVKASQPRHYASAVITIEFNQKGASQLRELTSRTVGKNIAMVVDDRVYAFPKVMAEIEGGRCEISGDFTKEEAKALARKIQQANKNKQ